MYKVVVTYTANHGDVCETVYRGLEGYDEAETSALISELLAGDELGRYESLLGAGTLTIRIVPI